MNQAHLHLVVNHFPIILPFVGLLLLIGSLILKSEVIKRTAYFVFVLGALFTLPAFATGEGADEVVEKLPEMSHKIIHIHEEAAETFGLFSYILGAVSALGFWASLKEKAFAKIITFVVLVVSLVTLFFAKNAGTTGGEIRHTEIRTTTATNVIESIEYKRYTDDN